MDREAFQERFGIIGKSPAIQQAIDRVRQVAPTDLNVLLEGESGVGKELFARAIHELSPRRHYPMVVVNCGAIPETLIESELFGAEKGAYTGAVERRIGYFEEADKGSIFLDEIGEMPLQAQVRLLRVLETGEFSRVGSSVVRKVDVRVIAATNKDLIREVKEGRFREDLYYRLSTVVIRIPPLRERKEDILPIFETFLYRIAQRYNMPVKKLDESAKKLLLRYRWPGNVRELRNVAEQVQVLVRKEVVTAEDIRPFLRGVTLANETGYRLAPASRQSGEIGDREREILYRLLLEMRFDLKEVKEINHAIATRLGVLPEYPVRRGGRMVPQLGPAEIEPVEEDSAMVEDLILEPEDDDALVAIPVSSNTKDTEEDSSPANNGHAQKVTTPLVGSLHLEAGKPLPTIEEVEHALIEEALRRFKGNRRMSAQALGISERTLYRKIKEIEEKETSRSKDSS